MIGSGSDEGDKCVQIGKEEESLSEEEGVVVLTEQDIGGFAKQPVAGSRVRGGGRREKRGGRGGKTAHLTIKETPGRGRQGKRKKTDLRL